MVYLVLRVTLLAGWLDERVATRNLLESLAHDFLQARLNMLRRFWAGIKGKMALKMALAEVRDAWFRCCQVGPVSPLDYDKTILKRETDTNNHAGEEAKRKLEAPDRPIQSVTEQQHHLATPANDASARRDLEENGEQKIPDCSASATGELLPGKSTEDSDARRSVDDARRSADLASRSVDYYRRSPDDTRHSADGARSGNKNNSDMLQVLSFPPEATPGSQTTRRRARTPLLQVLGFSAQLDRPSGTACVALVSEWPGVGSLHDFLRRKAGSVSASSQENLIRWTRQVAEGLVQTCGSFCDYGGGGVGRRGRAALRVSARNVFLVRRPKYDFQDERTVVLDAKVSERI